MQSASFLTSLARRLAVTTALLAALPATAGAQGNTGIIYGRVMIAGTHQPVCLITLTVHSDREADVQVQTRGDGTFRFLTVSPGPVRLIVGRSRATRSLDVSPNLETRAGDILLPPVRRQSHVTSELTALARRSCPANAYRGYVASDYAI
ncbi:MAG TPA: hypothetical protein VGD01_00150 [Candidatus Elarobacter sp.]|jgi:hypothetical protein